jgi:hypothetical protein
MNSEQWARTDGSSIGPRTAGNRLELLPRRRFDPESIDHGANAAAPADQIEQRKTGSFLLDASGDHYLAALDGDRNVFRVQPRRLSDATNDFRLD